MRVSENEIFHISRKACLASHIFEDYAEDIGHAIKHVHQNGFDGCRELETLLSQGSFESIQPPTVNSTKLVTSKLHPVKTAIPIIDWLLVKEYRKAIISDGIDFPVIIIALLAKTTIEYGGQFCIESKNIQEKQLISSRYNYREPLSALWIEPQVELYWCKEDNSGSATQSKASVFDVNPHIWKKLSARAFKTYVPETAYSRLSGAGAGLVDND
tara:strand:+ start:99 stop:740 length:642 start_codon:yes stop_codon:yes gene_type:complete